MSANYSSITSTIAITLTIVTLCWSVCNQKEQNRRWDEMNNANVDLEESEFMTFKQLNRNEVDTIDWGYVPSLYLVPASLDKMSLISALTLINAHTGNMIHNFIPCLTIKEIKKELNQGLIREDTGTSFIPSRYYVVNFEFENSGKTIAKDVQINILTKLTKNWDTLSQSNKIYTLNAGQSKEVTAIFTDDLIQLLPNHIDFRIIISYRDINRQKHQKKESLIWNGDTNTWDNPE